MAFNQLASGASVIPNAARVGANRAAGVLTLTAGTDLNWNNGKIRFATFRADAQGNPTANTLTLWEGVKENARTITKMVVRGGADNGNTTSDTIAIIVGSHLFYDLIKELNSAASGWSDADDVWSALTFAAASRTGRATLTASDSIKYAPGMRLRFTQDGAVKYALITKVEPSALTFFMPAGTVLTTSAVSNISFSPAKAPLGFTLDPTAWVISKRLFNPRIGPPGHSNQLPAAGWTDLGADFSVEVGPGAWCLMVDTAVSLFAEEDTSSRESSAYVSFGLRTDNNSPILDLSASVLIGLHDPTPADDEVFIRRTIRIKADVFHTNASTLYKLAYTATTQPASSTVLTVPLSQLSAPPYHGVIIKALSMLL